MSTFENLQDRGSSLDSEASSNTALRMHTQNKTVRPVIYILSLVKMAFNHLVSVDAGDHQQATHAEETVPTMSLEEQRTLLMQGIAGLIQRDGVEAWSGSWHDCGPMSAKVLREFPNIGLKLWRATAAWVHFYLESPQGLIVDPTWRQFVRGNLWIPVATWPEHLVNEDPVFIGTRQELVNRMKKYERYIHEGSVAGPTGITHTPETFVDATYGLGVKGDRFDLTTDALKVKA